MNHHDRLERMRALRDRVERLPASPERDRMLREVRARAVDIESGVRTAPLRPLTLDSDAAPPEPPKVARAVANNVSVLHPPRPRPDRSGPPARTHTTRVRADPARNRVAAASVAPTVNAMALELGNARAERRLVPLEEGVRLCLDDEVATVVAIEAGNTRPTSPWARGLRG